MARSTKIMAKKTVIVTIVVGLSSLSEIYCLFVVMRNGLTFEDFRETL